MMEKQPTLIYRPYIQDKDAAIRQKVAEILRDYPLLRKQGLEKMIFMAGLPVIKKNLRVVKLKDAGHVSM